MSITWRPLRSRWVRVALRFSQRHPWLLPLLGFSAGWASFLLVERGEAIAKIIAATITAGWLVVLLEPVLVRLVAKLRGRQTDALSKNMIRFAAQAAHQETFFFVIPFFFASTVWEPVYAVFFVLLCVAALLSVIDPFYFNWLGNHRGWYLIYHSFAIFAAALTLIPIIGRITTAQSYNYALLAIAVFALPSLLAFNFEKGRRTLLLFVLLGILTGLLWLVKPWVPPSTLRMTTAAITQTVNRGEREPGAEISQLPVAEIWSGLYAFTAVRAPRGLEEAIFHVWIHNGREVDRIRLDVHGEREAGYRTWSYKEQFGPDPKGSWRVELQTNSGQRLGVLKFQVE